MMKLLRNRKRGRPKRRFMDAMKKDMAVVEMPEEDADANYNQMEMEKPLWRPLTGETE